MDKIKLENIKAYVDKKFVFHWENEVKHGRLIGVMEQIKRPNRIVYPSKESISSFFDKLREQHEISNKIK